MDIIATRAARQVQQLGAGIYTVAEAARLLHKPTSTIRRWVEGYSFKVDSGVHRSRPLVRRDRWEKELSFLDLTELLVIRAFRDDLGLTMKAVRTAATYLQEHYPQLHHPLASLHLQTDGKDVFLRVAEHREDASEEILNVSKKGQAAFVHVVEKYLQQLDFNKVTTMAERWWPLGKNKPVVLDPRVAFGAPHIAGTGIPTRTLWGAVHAGDSIAEVAKWFDVEEPQIRAAVEFEDGIREAA